VRIADTVAAELAQRAWLGIDEPGAVRASGIRLALQRGIPGDITLEDVGAFAQPALRSLADAGDPITFEARLVGAIAAAMIMGAKLQETNGT
jgi:hypothetical protein